MKKRLSISIVTLIIIIIAISSCTQNENKFLVSGDKMVKVNDEYITEDLINLFGDINMIDEEQKQLLLDELINNFLIYREAMKSDVMKDTIFVNQLELQRRLAISNQFLENQMQKMVTAPTEDEIQAYYQLNKKRFDESRKFAVIFIHPQFGKSFADSLHDLIKRNRKSFRNVAKEFSIDTVTGSKGGVIERYFSYMDWTMMGYPMLDSIGFTLKDKGSYSEPVQTVQGTYAIVKLMDVIPSNKKYSDLRQLIMSIVYQQKRNMKYETYINKLRQNADIEYYDQN